MTESMPGPSGPGTVVLDIGAGTGALVLHAPGALDGREIEISLADGAGAPRTHSRVRERRVAGRVSYAAVYPGLPAGDYTVWRDQDTPAGTAAITGGHVTSFRWR